MRVLVATLMLLAALGASAQPLDSLATAPVLPEAVTDTTDVRTPRGAVTRALLAPGLGQLYNRQPLKAPIATALVVGTVGFAVQRQFGYRRIQQATIYAGCQPDLGGDPDSSPERVEVCADVDRFLDEWEAEGSKTFPALGLSDGPRDRSRGQRDIGVLIAVVAYAFQALDAYVAAELADFDVSEDVVVGLDAKLPAPGVNLTVRL